MRRTAAFYKRALLALLAALSTVGLAACGEGSGSTATITSTSAASTPATTSTSAPAASTPTPTTPVPTAPTTNDNKPAPAPASSASGRGAASFRVPHGDNSIPDFGAEASHGDRARATAALSAFLRARSSGDRSTACSYLAASTRKQLERFAGAAKGSSNDCATVLAAVSKGGEAGAGVLTGDIVALRIKGDSAFALYRGSHNGKYVMPMLNEGGAWKVNQPAPLPYPIGANAATP